MTKYYVYNVKAANPEDRIHAFVENPMAFAFEAFNPATMEFSGVLVEATDQHEAQRVYLHPTESDVFVSCDEPRPTELKRRAHESRLRLMESKLKGLKEAIGEAEIQARKLRVKTLILEIANELTRVSAAASELARQIRATASEEDRAKLSDEQVFERLMAKYAAEVTKLQYRPGQVEG